jgi:hypothetical protein
MVDLRPAMKQKLISLIRRTIGTEKLQKNGQVAGERAENSDVAASFPLPNWWERSFWEPTVALAIRDHCRPGDVVFDVGANAGALSLLMSRLVGPRGIVCAFEASPLIVDKTHVAALACGVRHGRIVCEIMPSKVLQCRIDDAECRSFRASRLLRHASFSPTRLAKSTRQLSAPSQRGGLAASCQHSIPPAVKLRGNQP